MFKTYIDSTADLFITELESFRHVTPMEHLVDNVISNVVHDWRDRCIVNPLLLGITNSVLDQIADNIAAHISGAMRGERARLLFEVNDRKRCR